jgi:iron complex transport system permease protein
VKHPILVLLALLCGTWIAFSVAFYFGSVSYSPADWMLILAGNHPEQALHKDILFKLRLPRIILAYFAGGALALAGLLLQGIYRNPLVEPYTLGVSGGAALGVALVIVSGLPTIFGIWSLPLAGFIGATLVIFSVWFLSHGSLFAQSKQMLLTGIMISFVCSSLMMLILSLGTQQEAHSIIYWMMGSLEEFNPALVGVVGLVALLGLAIAFWFCVPLNALRLGHRDALSLGIDVEKVVPRIFLLASALAGTCIAVCGIIGFVGLVVPHMARSILGTDHRTLLPGTFALGGVFLLLCDTLARNILAPAELPVGVITGLIGGTSFIWILRRQRINTESAL